MFMKFVEASSGKQMTPFSVCITERVVMKNLSLTVIIHDLRWMFVDMCSKVLFTSKFTLHNEDLCCRVMS